MSRLKNFQDALAMYSKHGWRLVRVWSSMLERGIPHASTSVPDYRAMRENTRSLAGLGAHTRVSYNLTGQDQPERVQGARPGIGPRELNLAIESSSRTRVPLVADAPTVSTQGALPGALIPPYCG